MNAWGQLKQDFPWPEERPMPPALPDSEGWLLPDVQSLLHDCCKGEKAKVIIELGSWTGLSCRYMLSHDAPHRIVCIDHWKGSLEHLQYNPWKRCLPYIYEMFINRCWNIQHRIVPMQLSTIDGLKLCFKVGLEPDLIYIDASHEYEDVCKDILLSALLFPTATLVGDDYHLPSVRKALTYCAGDVLQHLYRRPYMHNEHGWMIGAGT